MTTQATRTRTKKLMLGDRVPPSQYARVREYTDRWRDVPEASFGVTILSRHLEVRLYLGDHRVTDVMSVTRRGRVEWRKDRHR